MRLELVRGGPPRRAAPLAYVNTVGGQDELVFDGDSIVVVAGGAVLAAAPQFAEELLVPTSTLPAAGPSAGDAAADAHDGTTMTIDRVACCRHRAAPASAAGGPPHRRSSRGWTDCGEVYGALVTGLRDYVAQERVQIGDARPVRRHRLGAGGRDRLRRASAARTCTASRCRAATPPSTRSRRGRPGRAAGPALARRCRSQPMVDAYDDRRFELTGLAEENLQARVRGTT